MTPVNSYTPETYYSLSVADEPGLSVNDVGGAMKFTNEDTPEAVRWINEQFDCNGRFPARCTLNESTNYGITLEHVKAYKDWSKTPSTSDAVNSWVSNWLSSDEIDQLRGCCKKADPTVIQRSWVKLRNG